MENLLNQVNGMTAQQILLLAVALLLLLFALLLVLLLVFQKRAAQAESESRHFAQDVLDHMKSMELDNDQTKQKDQLAVRDMTKALNEAMVRLMGEVTRTQQGQMDSLGGQLRAWSHQEEERMERMRQTMDKRLGLYEERLGGVNRTLMGALSGSKERMAHLQETVEDGFQRMTEDNRAKLEPMCLTVSDAPNAAADKRLDPSFDAVTQRLEQMMQCLEQTTQRLNAVHSLAGEGDELRDTLSSAQPQGALENVQLDALLAQMLAPEQYAQHARVRPDGEPVADFVVMVPEQRTCGTVYLPIDASLPMDEYDELCTALETGTRQEVDSACTLLESALCMYAQHMSDMLIAPPYTTDYAVLFLQSEGLFAQVLHINGLSERIRRENHMVIAGPTTFTALLTGLQMGFRSQAIEQQTQEALALLSTAQKDFSGLTSLLSQMQQRLQADSERVNPEQAHDETMDNPPSGTQELPMVAAQTALAEADAETPLAGEDEWD